MKTFVLLVVSYLGVCGIASAQTGAYAITNVNVISLENENVLKNQTVLVKGNLIERISKGSKVPPGYSKIDGKGKYVIPGMADMHAHLPGFQSQPFPLDDYLLLNLANGITTVRGMRGHPKQLAVRDSLSRGNIIAPQMFVSSPPITRQQNNIRVNEWKTRFADYRNQGYDFIKILSLDSTLYDSLMPLLKAGNWSVAGHSPDGTLRRPVTQGQNSIEHIEPFVAIYDRSPQQFDELIREMKSKRIFTCPDLYWYYVYGYQYSLDSLQKTRGLKYVSPDVKKGWINSWTARFAETEKASQSRAKGAKDISSYTGALKKMAAVDVKFLISPGDGTFIVPGFSYTEELEIFERAGIKPYTILRSASTNAAALLGQDAKWGMLKPGYRADLILLSENPLDRISNVRKIEGVMVNGQWLSKDNIQQRMAALESKYREK